MYIQYMKYLTHNTKASCVEIIRNFIRTQFQRWEISSILHPPMRNLHVKKALTRDSLLCYQTNFAVL